MSNHNDNEANATSLWRKLIPPGWNFEPDDQQLLLNYLRPMHDDQPFHRDVIYVVDLYGHCPNELTACYKAQGKKEWYFFTKRVPKYKNGTRPNRRAASGFWKATSKDMQVMNGQEVIGYKRALNYYQGEPSNKEAIKTSWIMYEYRLHEEKTTASIYRKTVRDRKNNCVINDVKDVGLQSGPTEIVNNGFWSGYVLCKVYKNERADNGVVKKEERKEVDLQMPTVEDGIQKLLDNLAKEDRQVVKQPMPTVRNNIERLIDDLTKEDRQEVDQPMPIVQDDMEQLIGNITYSDDPLEFELDPIPQDNRRGKSLFLPLENNVLNSQIDGSQLGVLRPPPVSSMYQGYPTVGASYFDELSAIFTNNPRRVDHDSNALYNNYPLNNRPAMHFPSSSSYMTYSDDPLEFELDPIPQDSQRGESLFLPLENNVLDSPIYGSQLGVLWTPPVFSMYQGYPTVGTSSCFDELSAIFTNKRRRVDHDSNPLYNHLNNCPPMDFSSSSSYMSPVPVIYDELSVIFQNHCNGPTTD